MGRVKGLDGSEAILKALLDGPKTIRQLQKETDLNWNAIYYWLRDKNNPRNLVLRGCVEEERIVDETTNRAQDMFRYRLTEYGKMVCLRKGAENDRPAHS